MSGGRDGSRGKNTCSRGSIGGKASHLDEVGEVIVRGSRICSTRVNEGILRCRTWIVASWDLTQDDSAIYGEGRRGRGSTIPPDVEKQANSEWNKSLWIVDVNKYTRCHAGQCLQDASDNCENSRINVVAARTNLGSHKANNRIICISTR